VLVSPLRNSTSFVRLFLRVPLAAVTLIATKLILPATSPLNTSSLASSYLAPENAALLKLAGVKLIVPAKSSSSARSAKN
jgi:hypothetical protein